MRDLAVAGPADGDRVQLGTAVAERDHRLGAGLRPAHGPPERLGETAEHDLLAVQPELGPEPTADVGDDDPDVGCSTPLTAATRPAPVRDLRRRPLVQPAVGPRRRRRADLERARGEALVHEPARDDHLATVEELVAGDVGHAERDRVDDDVAPARRRRAGVSAGERRLGVDDRLEHVVVDDDGLGGVDSLLRPISATTTAIGSPT